MNLWISFILCFQVLVYGLTTPANQTSTEMPNATDSTTFPNLNETTPYELPNVTSTATPAQNDSTASNSTTGTNTTCSANYTATAITAEFTSPNYPKNYGSNMYCEYRFNTLSSKKRAASNYGVELQFFSFEMEDETYCLYDYIEIYDGGTTNDVLIGRYCGTDIPPTAQGTKSTLLVIFVSDKSYNYPGFIAQYKEIDISYPNCKTNYGYEITATTSVQTIENAAYPNTYTANTDEYFLINNSGNLILRLVDLDVERAKGCKYDRIIIYDGACPSYGILDTHCGTYLMRWELSGPEYLIHFHTDSSVQKTGFKMEIFLGVPGTGAPTTTTTTIGPPVEAEIFLMDEVLTNYSIGNFPSRDFSIPIPTTVDAYLVGINDLDEVEQKLTTTVLIDARWQDDFLKWEPSKQGGVVKLLMPQDDVWKPDLALLNGFASLVQFGDKFMYVVVESNGSCQWRPYQILSSTCYVDMMLYPYDTQSCDLKFSTWSSRADQVTTTIGGKGMQKHEYYVENSQWTLLSITQRSETIGSQNVVTFTLTLKRNSAFIVFYIAIPVVMLALLNTFTFILPPASGEKASFSIVVFLSFVVYVIVTYQKMPENSDKLSLFALYILNMTFVSCLTVIITTFELRLIELDKTSKRISQKAVRFSVFVTNIKYKIMCIEKSNDSRLSDNGRMNMKLGTWKHFVSVLDFVFFWLFLIVTLCLTCIFLTYIATQ